MASSTIALVNFPSSLSGSTRLATKCSAGTTSCIAAWTRRGWQTEESLSLSMHSSTSRHEIPVLVCPLNSTFSSDSQMPYSNSHSIQVTKRCCGRRRMRLIFRVQPRIKNNSSPVTSRLRLQSSGLLSLRSFNPLTSEGCWWKSLRSNKRCFSNIFNLVLLPPQELHHNQYIRFVLPW